MAIEFIPNQPILFNDPLFAGQSCLNNDTRAYAQLAQAGDNTCIQWKNTPNATLFDCQMNQQPNTISNGNFDTLLTGWQQINIISGSITAPSVWSYSGTGVFTTGIPLGLFTSTGIPTGNLIMLSFYVSDPTIQISAGVGNAGTNSWNYIAGCKINSDGRVALVLYAIGGSDIMFFANGPVEIRDVIVRDINYYYCFTPNNESFSWSYVESLNGYEWADTVDNKPLTFGGLLITGTTYRFSFKIKGLPVAPLNYIGIYDKTTDALITSGDDNKEYTFYYTHTAANTPIYLKTSNPADMTGTILYDFKADIFNYDYNVQISNPDNSCASINYTSSSSVNPVKFYEDKIIWCFDWSSLESCDVIGAPLNSGCYKVTIIDNLLVETYSSYTLINYKATGSHDCSVMMIGDNTGYAFDFFFNDSSTSVEFSLKQRLRLLQFNPSYPAKSEEYLYSDGNHIRTYSQSGKFRTAWFDYCDEPAHDVIRLQLLSDTLTIDGKEFFCKAEDYEPEWGTNGKYNLAQSRVVLKAVEEKELFNKSCQ
jgi:hypothetical protein